MQAIGGLAEARVRAWGSARTVVVVAGAALVIAAVWSGVQTDSRTVAALVPIGVACGSSFALGRRSVPPDDEWMVEPTLDAAVRREVDRSRRHERPFAVVRVPTEAGGDPEGLRPWLRSTDQVLVDERRHPYVLLPETTAGEARRWCERAQGALGDLRRATVVAFPEDELTAAGALAVLRSGMGRDGA